MSGWRRAENHTCDEWILFPSDFDKTATVHDVVTKSFELAARYQWHALELGLVARCEWLDHHTPLTLAPTLGFGF